MRTTAFRAVDVELSKKILAYLERPNHDTELVMHFIRQHHRVRFYVGPGRAKFGLQFFDQTGQHLYDSEPIEISAYSWWNAAYTDDSFLSNDAAQAICDRLQTDIPGCLSVDLIFEFPENMSTDSRLVMT